MTVTTEIYAFAAQTMLAQAMDMVADNIANADTPAYKREQLRFREYFDKLGTDDTLSGLDRLRDLVDGPMQQTGNPLDLAIKGDGFFSVETPNGVMYTRNGRFTIDEDGNLATSNGLKVLGDDGGPLVFAPTDKEITIDSAGKVLADGGEVGTLDLVRFRDPSSLERAGGGLYLPRGADPEPADEAVVLQGVIEGSNVQPIKEITRMISVMRGYQSAQQIAEDEHDRIRQAIRALTDAN
ncbi:MAG: flagellar basal-body rod protein FlgF [Alphaproteobacteria bacterium]|nr:flagellar basal-body rod protein FlgF [Alphaproteobacteria bacterium]